MNIHLEHLKIFLRQKLIMFTLKNLILILIIIPIKIIYSSTPKIVITSIKS